MLLDIGARRVSWYRCNRSNDEPGRNVGARLDRTSPEEFLITH